MGIWLGWFQKNDVAELEKDKAKLLNKRVEIDNQIKAIDEKIAELKGKAQG